MSGIGANEDMHFRVLTMQIENRNPAASSFALQPSSGLLAGGNSIIC